MNERPSVSLPSTRTLLMAFMVGYLVGWILGLILP